MGTGDTATVNHHVSQQENTGEMDGTHDLHLPPELARHQHIILCTPSQLISCNVAGMYGHEAISGV